MAIYTGLTYHMTKGIQREFHWHPEVEVLFAVEGTSYITVKDTTFTMRREDVLVINSSMSHRVASDPDGILCYIKFPWKLLDQLIGSGSKIFACNSTTDVLRSYHELQSCFRSLVYEYINPTHKTECHEDILMLQILNLLIEHYQIELLPPMGGRVSDDLRIQQIIHYVNQNFQQNLSLSLLAEELFLSPSTLSRFFKKQTGIYFVDYVNQVRARFGLVELIYTDASITEIAVNSGFSNLSVFSRVFKEIYGMTPTDYRRQYRQDSAREKQADDHLRTELAQKLPKSQQEQGQHREKDTITADGRAGTVYQRHWCRGINIGFVDQLTQTNLRNHTLTLCKTLGFQYVRVWNVFSKRLMLTDGIQIGGYNYSKLDETLDFLIHNHIHPYLDLGTRPSTAVLGDGKNVFFEYQYIEFQSAKAWEAMLRDFLRHVVKRYGQEEVNQWIFELSCDRSHPDTGAFYQDEQHPFDFFEAYRFLWNTVRTFAPEAEVGGPGMIVRLDESFSRTFLERCVAEDCVPDFISFLMFPYAEETENGEICTRRLGSKDAEQEQVLWVRQLMRETGTGACKLYVCEWNATLSNRSILNDSCYRSAYIARAANQIWDQVDMACIRMGSDIVGSYYDSGRTASGNGGLLTQDGIRKPAYFAFQFLHGLGDYLVERGEGYLITRSAHGRFFILCYNYKWFSSGFFLRKEYELKPDDLGELFEDDKPLDLEIVLKELPGHTTYYINRQSISGSEGSLLREWSNFQYEESPECRKYLQQSCFPRMSMVKQTTRNNRLTISQHLQANEVVLLYLYADI